MSVPFNSQTLFAQLCLGLAKHEKKDDSLPDKVILTQFLMKLYTGETLTDDEMAKMADLARVNATPPKEEKKVRKIKEKVEKKVEKTLTKEEAAFLVPVDMEEEAPAPVPVPAPPAPAPVATTSYTVTEINNNACKARKIDDKCVIPGTESNRVYREVQCTNGRKKNDLCTVCARREDEKAKTWMGRVGGPIPEDAKIVGSAWFKIKYPDGLPTTSTATTSVTATITTEPKKEKVVEFVAKQEAVKEVVWISMMDNEGVALVRNVKNNNVYKANTEEEGEDMVLWDEFVGKWRKGEIDYNAEEDDDA